MGNLHLSSMGGPLEATACRDRSWLRTSGDARPVAGLLRRLPYLALALIVALPIEASAQAALAGSVKGGPAPLGGVRVEAASPALIEKTRVGITDTGGHYRIEGLRPGTYTVTFTLTGWQPWQRVGVELAGASTVMVDAELT